VPSFIRQRKIFLSLGPAFTSNQTIVYPSWLNIMRVPVPAAEWKLKTKQFRAHLLYY